MQSRASSFFHVDPGPTFWISLRYFGITRLLVAAVLLGALLISDSPSWFGDVNIERFLRGAVIYAALGAALAVLSVRPRWFYGQLALQLALDLFVITVLVHETGGPRGALAALYLLPIAGGAVLLPTLPSIGFASLAALIILLDAFLRELESDFLAGGLVSAGLFGIAYFAIALVMNRLASRAVAQESIARARTEELQAQMEVNRLAVADMQDGVLVLDDSGSPRSLNPAAAKLLSLADADAVIRDGWTPGSPAAQLAERLKVLFGTVNVPTSIHAVVSEHHGEGRPRSIQIEARIASSLRTTAGALHVVFLEDQQSIAERAQQLKLASMGRLTASIAHEIRNPLAAINHANALLGEGALAPGDQRLVDIVADNAARLNRIVENVLHLSRRGEPAMEEIDVLPFLQVLINEFCRDRDVAEDVVTLAVRGRPLIRFNPDHLRQILINLLLNARRYSSNRTDSIKVLASPVAADASERAEASELERQRIEITVQDDGPGIDAESAAHLFEPFFTTHHQGTGLGLYLARELCLANGATLGFVRALPESGMGAFVVNAAMAHRSEFSLLSD